MDATSPAPPYPLSLRARLDPGLSRWQWLVKWLLAIPHVFVLAFLWLAFAVLTVVAFFSILVTARYPRSIFEFNVGVLRWTWRVTYYAFGVLGTDRYPPFTLERTDYPADLDVDYPQRLSRGLVLVKWWLLALPHYVIVAILTGGAINWAIGDPAEGNGVRFTVGGGLAGVLVLIAVVILLMRGRYPERLFSLVMGFQRWSYRVAAYATLMTDQYPPFRLDEGGEEPPVPATPSDAPPSPTAPRTPVTH